MFDQMTSLAIGIGAVLVLAFAVAQMVARLVRSGLAVASGVKEQAAFRDPIQQRPIRRIRGLIFIATVGIALRPILEMLGLDLTYGLSLERVTSWVFQDGLRVGLIVALAYLAIRMTAVGVVHVEQIVSDRTKDKADRREFAERLQTISGLAKNAIDVVVVGAAILMVLQAFGVDITPLLTAAGIGGLAIGFGAQNLVRDVISGFFLILEDQIHVGDVIRVDGTGGQVESVRLRTIVLRDVSGTVHIIPNGSISTLSNMSKGFSYAVVDVGVAYKEDTDHVVEVLERVGADLRSDDAFAANILAPLEVLGIDDLGDSAVTIRVRSKTIPLKQWMIGKEMRRRIKKAFDTEGIEMPFPHLSVYFGDASKPFLTRALPTTTVDLAQGGGAEVPSSTARRAGPAADTGH